MRSSRIRRICMIVHSQLTQIQPVRIPCQLGCDYAECLRSVVAKSLTHDRFFGCRRQRHLNANSEWHLFFVEINHQQGIGRTGGWAYLLRTAAGSGLPLKIDLADVGDIPADRCAFANLQEGFVCPQVWIRRGSRPDGRCRWRNTGCQLEWHTQRLPDLDQIGVADAVGLLQLL
jgi:hypothetical protein